MAFFSIIGSFFGKIFSKDFLPVTLTILIAVSVFFNINTCSRLKLEQQARKQDKEIFNQNFSAFLDTIHETYNKTLNAIEYDKDTYLTTLDELAKYDSSLASMLNKVKGDIINAIDTKIETLNEPVEVDNNLEDYKNNNYGLRWDYNFDDGGFEQKLSGVSKFSISNNKIFPGSTTIDTNYMSIRLTYGFREYDNKYKVWAVSLSPRIKISELTGAYFIDKPPPYTPESSYQNRWTVGPYIGAGVNFDYKLQDPRVGWGFGLSIQYHLFGFGKKPIKQKKSKTKDIVSDSKDKISDLIE